MGGNAKKRGFTIHNRNALKIHTHTHNSKKLGSEQTRHNGVRVNDVILVQVIDSCF